MNEPKFKKAWNTWLSVVQMILIAAATAIVTFVVWLLCFICRTPDE